MQQQTKSNHLKLLSTARPQLRTQVLNTNSCIFKLILGLKQKLKTEPKHAQK